MVSPHTRQAGYNLVMLMVIITVVNVLLAASLPMWSHVIRRDKEEELIFRGLQYAEAIRLFQLRFQRNPVRLEELMEVKPRSIRRLWKDPMTENGKWAVIFEGMGQNLTPQPQDPDGRSGPGAKEPREEEPGEEEEDDDSGFGGPTKGDEVAVGPIKGVHSRSDETSILIFNGKERYDEWHFTNNLLVQAVQPTGGPGRDAGVPGAGITVSTRWIGRPWPRFLEAPQPQDGSLPGGSLPGGGLPGGQPNPQNRRNPQNPQRR
ncbi:MAG TPA: type II secretion system protein [Thermoanaerobaculia bacterium]